MLNNENEINFSLQYYYFLNYYIFNLIIIFFIKTQMKIKNTIKRKIYKEFL